MFENIRADFARFRDARNDESRLRATLSASCEYGFLAVLVYRYGYWARHIRPRVLSWPFKAVYLILRTIIDVLFTIRIQVNSEIGPGFHIPHYGAIRVRGTLGRNVTVAQGVTIGAKGAGKSTTWPVIGDNVYIGACAVVIGDIHVGSNVVIGANTTVVKDVPDNYRVVGAGVRMSPIVRGVVPSPRPADRD